MCTSVVVFRYQGAHSSRHGRPHGRWRAAARAHASGLREARDDEPPPAPRPDREVVGAGVLAGPSHAVAGQPDLGNARAGHAGGAVLAEGKARRGKSGAIVGPCDLPGTWPADGEPAGVSAALTDVDSEDPGRRRCADRRSAAAVRPGWLDQAAGLAAAARALAVGGPAAVASLVARPAVASDCGIAARPGRPRHPPALAARAP